MVHETQIPTACDRCHYHKVRCRRGTTQKACDRCTRLRVICKSDRPLKTPGRRAQPRDTSSADESDCSTLVCDKKTTEEIIRSFNLPQKLLPLESPIVELTIRDPAYIEQFILGPTFCKAHQQTVFNPICRTPDKLQDAYVACALSVPFPGEDPASSLRTDRLERSYHRASSALAVLRHLKVETADDVATCLALGGTLLTFMRQYGGKDSLAVCHRVLEMIKPVYESDMMLTLTPVDLGFLPFLIITDILECVMQSSAPTLRFRPAGAKAPGEVDRYMGVCGTILPYLHDVCNISHGMLHGADASAELDKLECLLEEWEPTIPAHFSADYTASEVAQMLCQAISMQQTALLIIYRLRHPYEASQGRALAIANNVFRHLELTKHATGRIPNFLDLTLLAICLEIPNWRERKRKLQGPPVSSLHQREEAFLAVVWELRGQPQPRSPIYWYHFGLITKNLHVSTFEAKYIH